MKIRLSNNVEYEVEGFTIPLHFSGGLISRGDAITMWDALTEENLSFAEIIRDDGNVAVLHDAKVMSVLFTPTDNDGFVYVDFYLSGTATEEDPSDEYAMAAKIIFGEVE